MSFGPESEHGGAPHHDMPCVETEDDSKYTDLQIGDSSNGQVSSLSTGNCCFVELFGLFRCKASVLYLKRGTSAEEVSEKGP